MAPILECNQLSKYYGSKMALSNVSFTIEPGRIVGLLGPNGSGKSTFIKIANGLLTPSQGSVTICQNPIGPESKACVSYLPDTSYLNNWMKVSALIDMFNDFYPDFDRNKAYEMLARLGISEHDKLKTMSKGTKEKVQLILVMSRNASLYLLDEPIGGVDPAARDYILNTILTNYNEYGAVLITTHLIADIESVLNDVLFLKQGQVVLSATADEIREQNETSIDALFREVFRC